MAKVNGPLMSLDARGSVASSMTFAAWRGVKYIRQRVVPSNPRTTAQTTTRNTFAALDELWKRMGALSRAPWEAEVQRRPLTPRNAIIRANVPALRGNADMTGWIGSMGALAGLPPTNLTTTGGAASGEIDATITSPAEPTDWTLDAVVAQAIADRDPAVDPTEFVVEVEDTAPTVDGDTTLTLTGLTAGADYVVSAWTRWIRPDGQTAYGASLTSGIVAATA